MELLVIFLARLAVRGTWASLLGFLGQRSASAYKAGFSLVLEHVVKNFACKIYDITRWSGQARELANAIRDAGDVIIADAT